MSGVEVVGLLLGVLPLLVSAIEHYDDALRPIHRFREFNSKSQRFCDELETERTIFQAECQLLLGEAINENAAIDMLNKSKHPWVKDKFICEKFDKYLGNLRVIYSSTISRIEDTLKQIDETFKDFRPSASLSSPTADQQTVASSRTWLRSRKRRLKFAFSDNILRTNISELRTQNEVLRVISSQIVRFDRQKRTPFSLTHSNLSRPKNDLFKFKKIRNASCRLYEALCHACPTHNTHLIKFCLEATYNETPPVTEVGFDAQIRFSIAYTPTLAVQIISPQQSVTGQSVANQSVIDQSITSQIITAHKSATDQSVTLAEQFAETDLNEKTEPPGPTSAKPFCNVKWFEVESGLPAGKPVHDLTSSGKGSQKEDFCAKLQKETIAQSVAGSTKNLVIVLDSADTKSYMHRIYYPSDQMPPQQGENPSKSLLELLSPSHGPSLGNIPQLYRIRIARSLVIALLKFYATPWLSDSWESKKVLFNNIQPHNWQSYTTSPPLIVQVSVSKESNSSAGPTISSPPPPMIPNMMLFKLGVMLLELAYGVPFSSLSQTHSSMLPSADQTTSDFNAAYHLANNVGVYFGAGYADLVKKCLRCDFGEGEDLDKPALQERLYEDVVCQLERMETGIRQSQGEI